MLTLTIYLSLFLPLLLSSATTAANAPPYTPTDYFLLDCGSSSSTSSQDNRNWDDDVHSKFTPSNMTEPSFIFTASEQNSAIPKVPFMTARIFHSHFTYSFPVSTGSKFLRLYFYPATYSNLDKTKSFFSVTSGHYALLTNFSAFLTVKAIKPPVSSFIKEFIVHVNANQRLDVTFSPSPNSYAFINGIEVVSIPDNFYARGNDFPIKFVNQIASFYIDNTTALETIHRLNVGGNEVAITSDTGMFRSWVQDDVFILGAARGFTPHRDVPINYTSETPAYTAPEIVYTTARTMDNQSLKYNLTWTFTVDSGFRYLLRLYFCEMQMEVTRESQRVFTIFISNQTAELEADVIRWSHGNGTPVYRDYVVFVPGPDGRRSKQDLWLAMKPYRDERPNNRAQYANAILNGLEIFKLNQSDGSLAGTNPEITEDPTPPAPYTKSPINSKSNRRSLFMAIVGSVVGGIALVTILGFLIYRRRKRVKHAETSDGKSSLDTISKSSRPTKTSASSLPSDRCRHFSLEEIISATGNFDDNFVVGKGGFGHVYKGYINNGATTVAIKRLSPSSRQGAHEFQTEIGMLSKLRHLHLVSLIGYCDDSGEMILVYDYMDHGTLHNHIYKSNNPPLSWKQRLQICIGAARGLHYLHTGAKRTIIHRDVKLTNILLDEKWVAKVSDFGLSKLGPVDGSHTHVSTAVKGSIGYLDPEYYRRQQLTDKSDVYSFGVVLFEVLCARPPIVNRLPREQVNLAEWARNCYRKGTLDQIIDPHLKGEIAPESLRKFGEVADSCVRDQGIERPAMDDVVWSLEFVLELQEEAAEKMGHVQQATTTDDDDVFSGSADQVSRSKSSGTSMSTSVDELKSQSVFSEILNPIGR